LPIITTDENDIKERLSHAYIAAVAARAGCQLLSLPVDRAGVDHIILPIKGRITLTIYVQAKATSGLKRIGDGVEFSFNLDRKTYNKLRSLEDVPALLVVLDLPAEPAAWLSVSVDALILRRAAYWLDLRGAPSIKTKSKNLRIPAANLFDDRAIINIMERTDQQNRVRSP
jgi:hypothetical protein